MQKSILWLKSPALDLACVESIERTATTLWSRRSCWRVPRATVRIAGSVPCDEMFVVAKPSSCTKLSMWLSCVVFVACCGVQYSYAGSVASMGIAPSSIAEPAISRLTISRTTKRYVRISLYTTELQMCKLWFLYVAMVPSHRC